MVDTILGRSRTANQMDHMCSDAIFVRDPQSSAALAAYAVANSLKESKSDVSMLPTDCELLGVAVPRQRRSNKTRQQQGHSSWTVSVLDDHHLVHEDEREALEALCFLSTGSCDTPVKPEPHEQVAAKPTAKQQQQQHSKGSSSTAEAANGIGKSAAASRTQQQLVRQHSPASDVSSGGCHGSIVLPNTLLQGQPTQQQPVALPEALPLWLDEIHPAALPDAGLMLQQRSGTTSQLPEQVPGQLRPQPSTQTKQLPKKRASFTQQQAQQKQLSAAHQQQQQLPPHAEQQGPAVAAAAAAAGRPMLLQQPAISSWGLPGLPGGAQLNSLFNPPSLAAAAAAQQALLLGSATDGPAAAMAAAAAFAAMGLGGQSLLPAQQLTALLQPGVFGFAAGGGPGLAPAQLAAAAAAAAATAGPGLPPHQQHALPDLLGQLLLCIGMPAGAQHQLLEHSGLQQPEQLKGSQQAAAGAGGVEIKRPAVKGCFWHVYIAKMIAAAQREEEQQQQQQQEAAGQRQPSPMQLVSERRQQRSGSKSPRAAAGAGDGAGGSPNKRQKKEQQQQGPGVPHQRLQQVPPLPDLLASTGMQVPNNQALGLAFAAAAAAAAGQAGAPMPLLPPALAQQLLPPAAAGPLAPGLAGQSLLGRHAFLPTPAVAQTAGVAAGSSGPADVAVGLGDLGLQLPLPGSTAVQHLAGPGGARVGAAAAAAHVLPGLLAPGSACGQQGHAGELLLQLLASRPDAARPLAPGVAPPGVGGPGAAVPACGGNATVAFPPGVSLPGTVPGSTAAGLLGGGLPGVLLGHVGHTQQVQQQLHALKLALMDGGLPQPAGLAVQ